MELNTDHKSIEKIDAFLSDLPARDLNRYAEDLTAINYDSPRWQRLSQEAREDTERRNLYARRAQNMLARQARENKAADQKRAKEQEQEAARAAELEQFKQEARAAFPGSDADFKKALPRLVEEWYIAQTQQALSDKDRLIAKMKASGRYQGF